NRMLEGLVMRKSMTATELSSSSGAVRTLRILPGSSIRSPRCIRKIPPTASAMMPRPMPKAARKLLRMGSDLARDLHDLVHGLVRGGDQCAVEEVGFEADLAFVAVVIQRRENRTPIFFFRTLRHDTLALDLQVEHAFLGKQRIAVGEGLFL